MKARTRVALLLGVVAVGAILAFAGARPQGFLAVADAGAHEGQTVQLKGTVVEGSLDRNGAACDAASSSAAACGSTAPAFLLSDGSAAIEVKWDPTRPLPDHEAGGTIEGKNVVVQGVVMRGDAGLYVLASEMQVGCASKYRAA